MTKRGFTLIELMIVVAIVGILTAVAVPTFQRFQLRAKAGEAKTNIAALRTAEESYYAEFGTYLTIPGPIPAAAPGTTSVAWPAPNALDPLGFVVDGSVFFQYLVTADNGGSGSPLIRFTAEAASNMDGDATSAFFGFVKPAPAAVVGIAGNLPGSTCAATGIYDPSSGFSNLLEMVGPCDAPSGRSVF